MDLGNESDPRSQWDSDEYYTNPPVSSNEWKIDNAWRMPLPPDLPYRNLYFWLGSDVQTAVGHTAQWVLQCEFRLNLTGALQARIPVADGTDPQQAMLKAKSIYGLWNPATPAGGDVLKVVLSKKFGSENDTVQLVPHKFACVCDEITFNILRAAGNPGDSGMTQVRLFCAVFSANFVI